MTEENQEKNEKNFKEGFSQFHDKQYKKLLIIPAIIFFLSVFYIFAFYSVNGDFVHKDFSLSGGTSITIQEDIDSVTLETELSSELENLNTRQIYDVVTREKTGLVVQTKTDSDTAREVLEDYLGYMLTDENSSFEFISPELGENFYKQLLMALAIALFFMAVIVFIIFRTFIPSLAVIVSVIADVVMTLALVNLFGIEMSAAGLVAFLMIIGYSVDTDILLTNRILKRHEGTLNERISGAFSTGITMTTTSIIAVSLALFVSISFSIVLSQIFTVLLIGLFFDVLNTWITNASIIKWYVKRKGE